MNKLDISDILDYDLLIIKWTPNDNATEKSPWSTSFIDIKSSFQFGLTYQFTKIYGEGATWQSLAIRIYSNYVNYWSIANERPKLNIKWIIAVKY